MLMLFKPMEELELQVFADVINDLPEPEIVQAGNVRKSSSKVIGFIKK